MTDDISNSLNNFDFSNNQILKEQNTILTQSSQIFKSNIPISMLI
jgi:hypothetical protein